MQYGIHLQLNALKQSKVRNKISQWDICIKENHANIIIIKSGAILVSYDNTHTYRISPFQNESSSVNNRQRKVLKVKISHRLEQKMQIKYIVESLTAHGTFLFTELTNLSNRYCFHVTFDVIRSWCVSGKLVSHLSLPKFE